MTPIRAYHVLLGALGAALSLCQIPLLAVVQLLDLRVGWVGSLAWSGACTCAAAWVYLWTRGRIRAWGEGRR